MTHNQLTFEGFIYELERGEFSNLITTIWHKPEQLPKLWIFRRIWISRLMDYLKACGFSGLYSHQAASFEAVRQGKNIIVSTGTSSGKTWCYNLPVLHTLLKLPETTRAVPLPHQGAHGGPVQEAEEIDAFCTENTPGNTATCCPRRYL